MPQAVCFDLDGTLFDDRQYVRAGLESAGEAVVKLAGVDLSAAFEAAYFERDIRTETFDVVLEEHDLPTSYVPELVEAYHNNSAPLTPYLGTEAALSTLADEYALGLITGGRNGAEKLERLGLDDYFDCVLVTSGRPYSKHDPDPFERVHDTLGVPFEASVYVGDRPALDFAQPNRLGMRTVRVTTGQYDDVDATGMAEPDVTIQSVNDLPKLFSHQES